MANFPSSPGVSINELDNTFITGTPVKVGAAIIGPTVKGPVEIPIVVTSYSDYKNRFGGSLISGSDTFSYLTSIAAYNYFVEGGESLLVARVTSGSYSPATTSTIYNSLESGVISTDADALLTSFTSVSASAQTLTAVGTTGSLSGTGATITAVLDTTSSISSVVIVNGGSGYVAGETLTVGTGSMAGGATPLLFTLTDDDIVNSSAFTLETLSEGVIMNSSGTLNADGTLVNGTLDNVRWEITAANTGSGTFSVAIRRGDDKTADKITLESFNNVSLDPNSTRYISRVIGDQVVSYDSVNKQIDITEGSFPNASRYVRVKNVTQTPNYLNSSGIAVSAYTSSIPLNGNGSFSGASGDVMGGANFYNNITTQTQGLVAGDYTDMIDLLANKNEYQFNILSTPGLLNSEHASAVSSIITNTIQRGDNIYVVDMVGYEGTLTEVVAQAASRNTSYASTYWPWLQIYDPETGKQVWVPASTLIPGVYVYTDKVSNSWNAPAGISRGGLSTVLRAKQKLSEANKTSLYDNNVNPINTFPKKGVVVFGQKTLQKSASALDRVGVRRSLLELKSYIGQVADNLVFEQNTTSTRNSFLAIINPYLEAIQQKGGLYSFQVIMDDKNNTNDVIDRNQLVGQIYIQPTRTAEFVSLDFILLPTGAEFPA